MAFRSRPSFVMPAPNRLDRHGTNLAVLLLSLSQPYTGATAVLVDELDARRFHTPAARQAYWCRSIQPLPIRKLTPISPASSLVK